MAVAEGAIILSKSSGTGLAAFTRKPIDQVVQKNTNDEIAPAKRTRGKGDTVALTVRLRRAEWERLHQLAVSEGTSIQQLAVQGLSRLFTDKGLPGLI